MHLLNVIFFELKYASVFPENWPEGSAASLEQIFLHFSTSSRKFGTSEASCTNSSALQEGIASLTNEIQSQEDTHHCPQKHQQGENRDSFHSASIVLDRNSADRKKKTHTDTSETSLQKKRKKEERGWGQWSIPDCFLWQGSTRSSRVTLAKLGELKDKLTFATPLQVWAGTWAGTRLWRWGHAGGLRLLRKKKGLWCFLFFSHRFMTLWTLVLKALCY